MLCSSPWPIPHCDGAGVDLCTSASCACALSCGDPFGRCWRVVCVFLTSHVSAGMEFPYPPRHFTLMHDAGGVPPRCMGTSARSLWLLTLCFHPDGTTYFLPRSDSSGTEVISQDYRHTHTHMHTHIYINSYTHTLTYIHIYALTHSFIYFYIHLLSHHTLTYSPIMCLLGQSMDTSLMDVPIV